MPQKIEGFWKCPRCDSNEVYFAKRQVGQLGVLKDGPGSQNPIMSRSIEADVGLCKNCGERSNYTKPKFVYSDLEKLKARKTQAKFAGIFMLPGGIYITISSFQAYSHYDPSAGFQKFIALGVLFSIIGLISLIKGFKPTK